MKVYRIVTVAVGAALAVGIAACGGSGSASGGLEVSSESFEEEGKTWPFWTQEGTVYCEEGAVYFSPAEGGQYAVNGAAVESGEYSDPDSIRLDDPQAGEGESLTGQVPLDDMIAVGEELCG